MVVRVLDVPLYAGVAVTELGTGVAALVYGAGLLLVAAFGLWRAEWVPGRTGCTVTHRTSP